MNKEPRFGGALPQSQWIQRYIRRSNFNRSDFHRKPEMEASDWYFVFAVFIVLCFIGFMKL